ncbi:hypothetical protein QCE47_18465 [Caballeronia sp. LZ025]|uniref:hypothetical protein n=1 Tax=Caballeronia TaxID=1827195 RepID=UPI001FCFDF2B|nr:MULTISPECIES: hypothetical protein [Caballeronia]MDR5734292.1 hypothetical protein [Caballeronia sp. LZ025]
MANVQRDAIVGRPGAQVQTVHGFNFAPDVDGLVLTAAQRSLEPLAAMRAPALVPLLQRAGVTRVNVQTHESAAMPLVELLEMEYRATDRGHMVAGLPLLIAFSCMSNACAKER